MLRICQIETERLYQIGTRVVVNLRSPDVTAAGVADLGKFLRQINEELSSRGQPLLNSPSPK